MNDAEFIVRSFIFLFGSILINIGLVYVFISFFNFMAKEAESEPIR